MTDTITSQLNSRQREAVLHGDGPLLILAGAGSGKTRVLTHRLAHLVQERGIRPHELLAFTFTNRAAREMRERIEGLIGPASGLWVGTFHSICVRILRRHPETVGRSASFTIYDADDQRTLIRRCLRDLGFGDAEMRPQAVQGRISQAKNRLLGPAAMEEAGGDGPREFDLRVAKVYREYDRRLAAANAFDFDDLILRSIELLRGSPDLCQGYAERFRHVLVDEYQDTNHAQYVLITLLASVHRNLTAVGDDDQSIYSWRGADIRNILSFEETYPDACLVRLEQNYRSTQRILKVANQVVLPIRGRKPKTLWTENPPGDPLRLWLLGDEDAEAETVTDEIERRCGDGDLALRDCVILYRTHAQSRALEGALRRRSIRYQIIGGVSFYDRREVKDVLAYLRLVASPRDEVSFLRVINQPKRGIGKTTVERVRAHARRHELGLLECCAQAAGIEELGAAARRRLTEYHQLLEGLTTRRDEPVPEQIRALMEEIHYAQYLEEEDPLTAEGRVENLDQLVAAAAHFASLTGDESLEGFLADVALVADLDEADDEGDCLTLMTTHNAKGLEFDLVVVTGLEQGIFPHVSAFDDEAEMEEERRLFYVALTRARRQVILTAAQRRLRFGRTEHQQLSEFVEELCVQAADDLEVLDRTDYDHARTTGDLWSGTGRSREVGTGGGWRSGPARRLPGRDGQLRGGGRGMPAVRRRATATPIDPTASEVTDYDSADAAQLDPDEWGLAVGAPVMHAQFGRGTVVAQDGQGPDARLTVRFEGAVTRKLVARYLSLLDG